MGIAIMIERGEGDSRWRGQARFQAPFILEFLGFFSPRNATVGTRHPSLSLSLPFTSSLAELQ